jgi:hypothetical protein
VRNNQIDPTESAASANAWTCPVSCRARAFCVGAGIALALALDLSARSSIAQSEARTRPGPIIIVYRDDTSNVRQLKGIAHYVGVLGRDPSVSFTVVNEGGEKVCNGSFTSETRRAGKFALTCFNGYFSGNGGYEVEAGDRRNSFFARGQTARGLPIMLVVGKPSGFTDGQFLSP